MNEQETQPVIDWSKFRPTPLRVVAVCCGLLAIIISVSVVQFSQVEDNILSGGAPLGGDYIAFYGAAHAAADGEAGAIYDYQVFENKLQEIGPPLDKFGLTWQYPPTYYFFILPLTLMPFVVGYIVWSGAMTALYFTAMRAVGFSWLFLFVIFSSPSTFQAIITGQNGFLTAALMTIAALYPGKRPIIAGLAAALLTVKPQLGLLLPIAYMAAGCWRAFFTAAIGAIALAIGAAVAFGPQIWLDFIGGAGAASDLLSGGVYPLHKMVTPFAWFRQLGLPFPAAAIAHGIIASAAIATVFHLWRTIKDAALRAAIVCAGIFFVAPYGYYYEIIVLAYPAALIAKRAIEKGWLPYEQIALSVIFMMPMIIPNQDKDAFLGYGFPCIALLAGCLVRRINHEYPGSFRMFRFLWPLSGRKAALEN